MTRNLSVKNGTVIVIEGPRQVRLNSTWTSTFLVPGDGQFTVDADREVVGQTLKEMVGRKLHALLVKGDLHGYRLLLNLQHVWLRNSDIAPVPGFLARDESTKSDQIADDFLLQHGFSTVCEYDKAGWSPLCYAALRGNPEVVEALLSKRGSANEALRKPCGALYLTEGMCALGICIRFGNNEAMQSLLRAQADPNKTDSFGSGPLDYFTGYSDNVDGARLLLEARADAGAVNHAGANAIQLACMQGASEVLKELLNLPGEATFRQESLHWAIFLGFSSVDHMSLLLQIGCDVNEQFRMRRPQPGVHLFMRLLAVKHYLSTPTPLNTFAYHWRDATPLMLSIIVGSYSISWRLLEAKARVDLRNSRKQTAFDLAIKQGAPDALLWELWRRGAGNYASKASISLWRSNAPEEHKAEDQVSVTASSSIPMEETVQDPEPTFSI